MSSSREELRVLMRPWTQGLRDWEYVLVNSIQRHDVVWIRMSHGESGGFLPVVYEAIELLTLVGELDVVVWREAVQLIWEHSPLKLANASQALRFGLDLSSCYSDDITVASYCDRVLSTGVTSSEYSTARTKLETLYKEKEDAGDVATPRGALQIPVRVGRYHFEIQGAEVSMRKLSQIVERQAVNEERNSPSTQAWPLLMKIVRVSIGEHGPFMNAEAFEFATKIVARGVPMEALSLCRVPFVEEKSLQYIQGLQLLMGARQREGINIGVTRVTIPASISERMASAAYSALFKSESVDDVDVSREKKSCDDAPDESHDLTWQWMALTLFTTHATQSFDDVTISVENLLERNTPAIDAVLNDPNPLLVIAEAMYPGIRINDIEAKNATVSKIRLSPPKANDQAVIEISEQTVEVIGRHQEATASDGWYCVLLPGWGPAWVKHEDCTLSGSRTSETTVRAPSRLRLTGINPTSMFPVASLMRSVGNDVKSLTLDGTSSFVPMDDWWLDFILRACPQLESLTIEGNCSLTSLNAIAEYFECNMTRVRSITLRGIHVVNTATSAQFFLKLADPNHKMTRRLRSLTLRLDKMSLPFTSSVPALHTMLDTNRELEVFDFTASYVKKLLKRDMLQSKDFSRHNYKVTVGRPLSLRQKLAVLSTMTHSSPQIFPGAHVLREFDSKVLSLILQFGAATTTRRVHVNSVYVAPRPRQYPEY